MTAKEITEAIFAEWQASCARYPEGYPSPLGPIVERHIQPLIELAYHTAPGEMEFGGEGWTWKQQARADHDRLLAVEAERNKVQRVLEAVALRLDELHAKIDALARKPEP